jgi:hypothetical protein
MASLSVQAWLRGGISDVTESRPILDRAGGPIQQKLSVADGEPCEQGGGLFEFEKVAVEVVGEDH